jgi:hypothetical protein
MLAEVYKRTDDDWYPSYKLVSTDNTEDLVLVSYYADPTGTFEFKYQISAWGNDDFGVNKWFNEMDEYKAWTLFLEIIGQEKVNWEYLHDLGFTT